MLDLDTAPALKRPKPASTREKLALACATAVAALAGWRHFGTVAGLLGAALSGLAAATAVEIALKVRDDRQEAAARVLDEAAWRTRLREAAGSGPGVLDP